MYAPVGSAKAAKRLRIAVLTAALCDVKCIAHVILHRLGKFTQILTTWTDPDHRPHLRFIVSSSSSVRGQSDFKSRERLRSASSLPPVWQRAQ